MVIKGKRIGTGRPCICVPVMEKTKNAIIQEIKCLSESCADMIEWRVDAFEDFSNLNAVRDILEEAKPYLKEKIFLYTFRTAKQGGNASISSEDLNDLHDIAAESGCVDLLDMEYFEEEKPAKKIKRLQEKGIRIVASHHDFEMTPEKEVMKMLLERMCAGNADIVKLAVMPQKRADVLSVLEVTGDFKEENPDTPVISMSMGKLGVMSRLAGESFGSCVTFASHRQASAPGQMEMNRVHEILEMIHESIEQK